MQIVGLVDSFGNFAIAAALMAKLKLDIIKWLRFMAL